MAGRDLSDRVQEIDPYAFLHEVSEEIPPPETPNDPDAWIDQQTRILQAFEAFENPALRLIGDLAEPCEELPDETDDVSTMLEHDAYLVGLSASIAQTHYWCASLCLEKLDGYHEAIDDKPDKEIGELRESLEAMAFENSFRMWKNGLTHLMYMNHEPFFQEAGFNYLDYHDKIHVSFVILTAATLVETPLGRILVDLDVDDARDKTLNNLIDMTWSRTELTEKKKNALHDLRRARNLVAHDISQRTDYRGPDEVKGLDNHFEATFGVTVRALNVATDVLDEVYGFREPFEGFHRNAEEMVDYVLSEEESNH